MTHQPTYYGRTFDQALWNAAQDLDRELHTIEYRTEELEDGQVMLVVLDEGEREGPAPEPPELDEPVRSAGGDEVKRVPAGDVPAVPEGLSPGETARVVLQELLERMGTSATIKVEEDENRVRIDLSDADDELLLGRDARVLDSLQYIVSRAVQNRLKGGPAVSIDVGGHMQSKRTRIVQLANELAENVVANNRGIAVDGLMSADRRVIHHTIGERTDVHTESEGMGAFRRLLVKPGRAPKRPPRPRGEERGERGERREGRRDDRRSGGRRDDRRSGGRRDDRRSGGNRRDGNRK